MSIQKKKAEAKRWLQSASSDLETAQLVNEHEKFSYCCFLCQQAAEKALKAVHFYYDHEPWGHSITKLIDELALINPQLHEDFQQFIYTAKYLDRLYISTRYPDGLPDITPEEAYTNEDAEIAFEKASTLVIYVQSLLN
jgi:HEPN domain-containing protein